MPNDRAPKLQCYCCGAPLPLDKRIALVSMSSGGIDRVFLFRPECTVKVEPPKFVVVMKLAAKQ